MKKQILEKIFKRMRLNQRAAIFLLCVFCSMIFWIFTSLSKEYETHFTIPVSYRNIPFTKYFDSELPQELDLYFRGSGFRLAGIHFGSKPDSITIDVASFSNQQKQLNLQTGILRNQFPGDFKPYKIVPESISAGFNSRLSKKVPIVFNGSLSFKPGFETIGHIVFKPDSVELAGPGQLLDKVSAVKTTWLTLKDVSSDKQGVVALDSASFKGLAASFLKVSYFLPVEEFTEGVVEVPVDIPVSQRNRVTLIPNSIKITYTVALSSFKDVENGDFVVATEVPFSDMPARLRVHVRKKPGDVRIVKMEPEFIDYLIQK